VQCGSSLAIVPGYELTESAPVSASPQYLSLGPAPGRRPQRLPQAATDGSHRLKRLLDTAAVIGARDRPCFGKLAVDDEMPAAALFRSLEDLTAFAGSPLIDVRAALPPSANREEWLDHLDALATRASRGQVSAVLPPSGADGSRGRSRSMTFCWRSNASDLSGSCDLASARLTFPSPLLISSGRSHAIAQMRHCGGPLGSELGGQGGRAVAFGQQRTRRRVWSWPHSLTMIWISRACCPPAQGHRGRLQGRAEK
jgi:hypothetical protein